MKFDGSFGDGCARRSSERGVGCPEMVQEGAEKGCEGRRVWMVSG